MSRSNWWIDYIERELEPALRAQMKAILKKSPKDQKLVDDIQATRNLLKENDIPPARGLEADVEDDFFAQMEANIMASVAKTEIKKISNKDLALEKAVRKISHHRKPLGRSAALGGLFLTALLAYSFISTKSLNTQWDINQEIAHQLQAAPDEVGALMTYQNEHDFFVDVASQSLDHLTKEQFETLMGSSKMTR
jgi:hypothetical protein